MDEIIKSFETLETNLITVINELKASTESILKELTIYISHSARELSEIRESTSDSEAIIRHMNTYMEKLNTIESKILQLPVEFINLEKIIAENKNTLTADLDKFQKLNNNYLKQVGVALSKKIDIVSADKNIQANKLERLEDKIIQLTNTLNEYKIDINANQERMSAVVKELIKSNRIMDRDETELKKKAIEAEDNKIKTNADIIKSKIMLIIKIISVLGASGGAGYLIIEYLLRV